MLLRKNYAYKYIHIHSHTYIPWSWVFSNSDHNCWLQAWSAWSGRKVQLGPIPIRATCCPSLDSDSDCQWLLWIGRSDFWNGTQSWGHSLKVRACGWLSLGVTRSGLLRAVLRHLMKGWHSAFVSTRCLCWRSWGGRHSQSGHTEQCMSTAQGSKRTVCSPYLKRTSLSEAPAWTSDGFHNGKQTLWTVQIFLLGAEVVLCAENSGWLGPSRSHWWPSTLYQGD